MNQQKFLAELSKLLGFMASWDKDAEINKYTVLFESSDDHDALIDSLGSPTQIAISIARDYKPSPRPGSEPPESEEHNNGTSAEAVTRPESAPKPPPPPPPPPPEKRDELQVVTDGEFEYGMELAILMGEPISAAVESALEGKYLPDPEFSLEEILGEVRDVDSGHEQLEITTPEPPVEAEPPVPEIPAAQEEEPQPTVPEEKPGPQPEEILESEPGPESKPESKPEQESEPEPESGETDRPVFDEKNTAPMPETVLRADAPNGDADAESEKTALSIDPDNFAELPPDVTRLPDPEHFAELPPDKPPRPPLRPAMTAVFSIFMLFVGLPVALVLIFLGLPILLAGGGTVALAAYGLMTIIPALSMFSDILLVAGAGLAVCGVGLFFAWLGLWVSIELGSLWINAVVLPLGASLCYRKEADSL